VFLIDSAQKSQISAHFRLIFSCSRGGLHSGARAAGWGFI